jgi:nucleotide-binding universal stress UspA family protein
MYTRLLVPLDRTPESEAALSPAHVLAKALWAEMVLMHVLPTNGTRLSVLNSSEPRQAQEYLEGIAARLRGTSVAIEVVVSQGSPADTIVAEAHSRGADLIVMTTHGRNALGRQMIGSVTERVLTRAPMPLVAIRPTEFRMQHPRLILVPVDGSPGSLVALGTASRLALAAHAAVVLLRVVVPLPLWIYDPTLGLNTGPLIDPRWDEDRRASAEAYVRQVAQSLAESGIEVGADALLGEVAPTIAEYADQEAVDLIVIATHAHRGAVRVVLGSVADQLIRMAQQPVLLVRRTASGT